MDCRQFQLSRTRVEVEVVLVHLGAAPRLEEAEAPVGDAAPGEAGGRGQGELQLHLGACYTTLKCWNLIPMVFHTFSMHCNKASLTFLGCSGVSSCTCKVAGT